MSEIFRQVMVLLDGIVDFLRKNPKPRALIVLISTIVLIFSILSAIVVVANLFNVNVANPDDARDFLIGLGSVAAAALVCAFLSGTEVSLSSFVSSIDKELQPIRKEREAIRHRLKNKEPDIFDTVQLNLNQLTEYYAINKDQARNSYRASITAILVGLITLVVGMWLFYFTDKPNNNLTYLTSACGVLLQFIGGAYFYLYNRSLAQLNFFFSRLALMQDTMLSIKLCERITDADVRTRVLEKLIFIIVSRDLKAPDLLAAAEAPTRPGAKRETIDGTIVASNVLPHPAAGIGNQ